MKSKILFLDTLSTGMNPRRCGIYKMGGIFCEDTADCTRETGRFMLCVNPWRDALIIENSLWIGKTTRSDLLSFPSEAEACETLVEMLSERVDISNPNDKFFIAGYNVSSLDHPLLRALFERAGQERFRDCFHVQAIDLASVAAFALSGQRRTMENFLMNTVAGRLGVVPTVTEKYDCLANAETCLKMYCALKRSLGQGKGEHERTDIETITNV